jgi:hypothetical protein
MKSTMKLLIAITAVVGLAAAGTIPALAQNEESTTEPVADCPFHDQDHERLTLREMDQDMDRYMDQWMDQDMDRHMDQDMYRYMDQWRGSTSQQRMQESAGDWGNMMGGYGPGGMMGDSG